MNVCKLVGCVEADIEYGVFEWYMIMLYIYGYDILDRIYRRYLRRYFRYCGRRYVGKHEVKIWYGRTKCVDDYCRFVKWLYYEVMMVGMFDKKLYEDILENCILSFGIDMRDKVYEGLSINCI